MQAGTQHVHRIDVKNLRRMKVGPDALQAENRPAPLVSFGGEHRRRDAAGRSTDDDLKRITRRGSISVRARSTPTWYAEREPPPVSTSPTV